MRACVRAVSVCITMGCELTKLAGRPRSGDQVKSAAAINNPQSAHDPRLPMNARQKYSLLASWKGISRALEPTGIHMFMK